AGTTDSADCSSDGSASASATWGSCTRPDRAAAGTLIETFFTLTAITQYVRISETGRLPMRHQLPRSHGTTSRTGATWLRVADGPAPSRCAVHSPEHRGRQRQIQQGRAPLLRHRARLRLGVCRHP